MTSFVEWIKQIIREQRLRNRFPRSVIYSGVKVSRASLLGGNSVLFRNTILSDSVLGAYSYVQTQSAIYNAEIGSFCSIASGVTIGLAAHPTSMVSTSPVFYDNEQPLPRFFTRNRQFTQNLPRTVIGSDVWIGQGAMIKAGIEIGVGAVIGAGSMVTKNIPPYVIAAGNPCRPIRQRFPENIAQGLLLSRWWELDDSRLEQLAHLFSDPELLLEELNSTK